MTWGCYRITPFQNLTLKISLFFFYQKGIKDTRQPSPRESYIPQRNATEILFRGKSILPFNQLYKKSDIISQSCYTTIFA